MIGAGALHLGISPVAEVRGTGGVQGVHQFSQADRVTAMWGLVTWGGNNSAPGGPMRCVWWFSEVGVPSIKRREGGRQGDINSLPHRGFWGMSGLY